MNNNIELNDIKAFVAVAELGSFTKAANQLGITRGHISKQIKKLEEDMGVRLLIRTTRTLSLTTEGKLFFEESKASLTRLYQAVSSAIDDSVDISGTININSVGGIIGEDLLAPILAQFALKYPKIHISLDFSSTRSDLIGDKYDVILRMGKLDDSNFMAKKIADFEICTLASPKYLKQFKPIRDPKELKRLNCLTGSVKKWNFVNTKTNAKSHITVSGNFNCPSGKSLLNAAKSGLGVVRLPKIYCQGELKRNELVSAIKNWRPEKVPIYLLYYSNKLQPKKVSLLIEYISKNFNGLMEK